MLAAYDRAIGALQEALSSRDIGKVKASFDKIEFVKLHAKQIRDRVLLAHASACQMRMERWLGELLEAATAAGQLRAKGERGKAKNERGKAKNEQDDAPRPATLKEIGIDPKLSMRAKQAAALDAEAFEEVIAGIPERFASAKAILVDAGVRHGDKKERRAERERELAGKQEALPNKRYGVIYADPEWRFEVYSRDTGMDRSADNHYPTSATDAICARPVGDIAADDCALFLWATVPMLPDALRVMDAWGFTYKSHTIWKKDRMGTGYWFRNWHELLLVGTKGEKLPAPAMGTQFPSVIDAPVGDHSEKPDAFYELIEVYFPTLPKIELNARRARPGWDRWGLEAGEAA